MMLLETVQHHQKYDGSHIILRVPQKRVAIPNKNIFVF